MKTAMMLMIERIQQKIEAGVELGYDENHEGMIQLRSFRRFIFSELLEKEKEQIKTAWEDGLTSGSNPDNWSAFESEEYYSKTYKP